MQKVVPKFTQQILITSISLFSGLAFLLNATHAQTSDVPNVQNEIEADLFTTPTATTTDEEVATSSTNSTEALTRFSDYPIFLDDVKKIRLTNLAANMSNRMDATANRLDQITQRLESRIQKLELLGLDMQAAQSELAHSKERAAFAKSLLQTIDDEVQSAINNENPGQTIPSLLATFEAIAQSLRDTHISLRLTVAFAKTATVPSTPDSEEEVLELETAE